MKTKKNNVAEQHQEMFMCECHGESIMVSKYTDEEEVYFSFWGQGFNPKYFSWLMRIKLCWKILTGGNPYIDEVILSKDNTKSLCKYLNKITK